jgi:gamma-glutamylcyclotransferase (GGCT)/AIG2-like uncharacterized protein YtfP
VPTARQACPSIRYFAYGSNMASAEMGRWCEGHRFLGPARLDGHRLELRRRSIRWRGGTADIVPAAGTAVWGALYELPEASFGRLDAKEGEGLAYRRAEVEVVLGGKPCTAVAYAVIEKEPCEVPCVPEYRALLLSAASERGLPERYVRELERRLVVVSDRVPER